MRSAIFVLCLSLLAGAAIATLTPATSQTDKLKAEAPIELPDIPHGTLGDQSQSYDCSGLPDLGDCSQFPWGIPGVTCDCDVPVPFGTCSYQGYTLPVTKCYGVNLCGVLFDPCT